MSDQRYRDEVLKPYVRLFSGPDFIFMDDNASCHRTFLVGDFFEMENIQRMLWPANSPDLNPIEHVWDMLGRQLATLSHPPSSVPELKSALIEAWNRFSPVLIHHLIASLGNHFAACLAVRGDTPPGNRNYAARQWVLQIFLDLAGKSSKRNFIYLPFTFK